MNKTALLAGILCILVAVIVFVFADGLRRYYSGIFFVIMGIIVLLQARHSRRRDEK